MDFNSLTWALGEGERNKDPLLIRFREFPENWPKSKHPYRVNIFWTMSEPDENGLPSDEESLRLETFEDRLIDAVESDKHSILVAALTCGGEREFVFHTKDVQGFMERLRSMPQEEERYPITIQSYEDPDWRYFQSVIPG